MKFLPPLLLTAVLLLSGCTAQQGEVLPEENTFDVYFTSAVLEGASLAAEKRTVPEGTAPAEGLLRILLSGPAGEDLTSPIPAGTRLLSWSLGEDRVLTVDLSERYGGLAGVELTLADYCVALTLCQLPEVEGVVITVEGLAVTFRDHQLLRPSDVVLSGAEDAPVYITAPLYFPLRSGGLEVEQRELLLTENDELATVLLAALLAGPENTGAYFPAFEGVELLTAYVEAGVCYVNLPATYAAAAQEESADAVALLYSIVNTFCAHKSIASVHLLVDGASVEFFGGVPTTAPLEPNPDP